MKVVRLSALLTGRLYTPRNVWYSFLLEAESTPGPQCGREDYVNGKFRWHHRESNPDVYPFTRCLFVTGSWTTQLTLYLGYQIGPESWPYTQSWTYGRAMTVLCMNISYCFSSFASVITSSVGTPVSFQPGTLLMSVTWGLLRYIKWNVCCSGDVTQRTLLISYQPALSHSIRHLAGLLWTSDQPDEETSTWLLATFTTYIHTSMLPEGFEPAIPEGNRQLRRHRRRWEDNIKIDHQEVWCGGR